MSLPLAHIEAGQIEPIPRKTSVEFPKVSVLVPVLNEKEHLRECLNSILENEYKGELEIFVIDGKSNDGSIEIIHEFTRKHKNITLIQNTKRSIPAALNLGVAHATGEIIARMDAHATYNHNYIGGCVRLLLETDADAVGGIWQPTGSTTTSQAIALALRSRYAIGNPKHYFSDRQDYVESVPLGACLLYTSDAADE